MQYCVVSIGKGSNQRFATYTCPLNENPYNKPWHCVAVLDSKGEAQALATRYNDELAEESLVEITESCGSAAGFEDLPVYTARRRRK